MKEWCIFCYGDNKKQPTDWILNQYMDMLQNKQSDEKLLNYFKKYYDKIYKKINVNSISKREDMNKNNPNSVNNPLCQITKRAYNKSTIGATCVINNATPTHMYNSVDKDKKYNENNPVLFENRGMYSNVGSPTIDPQSSSPIKDLIQDEETTITINDSDKIFNLRLSYNVYQLKKNKPGKISLKIKRNNDIYGRFGSPVSGMPWRGEVVLPHKDPKVPSRVSEVIKLIVEYLKHENTTLDAIIKNTNKGRLHRLINIFTGKLCGDLSQEIFSVANILDPNPTNKATVFAANDGPSAVRALYAILCLEEQIRPDREYWLAYLVQNFKNSIILSSLNK